MQLYGIRELVCDSIILISECDFSNALLPMIVQINGTENKYLFFFSSVVVFLKH